MAMPLLAATIASTLAIILVGLLRRPIRAQFGSRAAYATWWLVPVVLLALALPGPPAPPAVAAALRIDPARVMGATSIARAVPSRVDWLVLAWGVGAVVLAASMWHAQRRFEHALGRLRRRGRVHVAERAVPGLPATLGLWRPRIVVPPGFDATHPRRARALMLLHERAHIGAFDLPANALAAVLRCVFWFNPLAHVAWRRFRGDQELACDARLLAAVPRARRLYAETLLGMQLAAQRLPIGCRWTDVHPLKERMTMLTTTLPSRRRRRAGLALVALVAIGAGMASAASGGSPVTDRAGRLHVVARIDGGDARDWRGTLTPGMPHHYTWPTDDGHEWSMDLTVHPQDDGLYLLDATLAHDGDAPSHPQLLVRAGQAAGIALGTASAQGFEGLQLSITVAAGKAADTR